MEVIPKAFPIRPSRECRRKLRGNSNTKPLMETVTSRASKRLTQHVCLPARRLRSVSTRCTEAFESRGLTYLVGHLFSVWITGLIHWEVRNLTGQISLHLAVQNKNPPILLYPQISDNASDYIHPYPSQSKSVARCHPKGSLHWVDKWPVLYSPWTQHMEDWEDRPTRNKPVMHSCRVLMG